MINKEQRELNFEEDIKFSGCLMEQDLKLFEMMNQAINKKFFRSQQMSIFYEEFEAKYVPKQDNQLKKYVCKLCDPPKIYDSKQQYAGHCKTHSLKTRNSKKKNEQEKQDIFRVMNV